jgi:predicted metal-binding membrane protein
MHIRDSFRKRFPFSDIPVIALVTYVIILLAWLAIVSRWLPMPGGAMDMQTQMSDPGVPEAMALSNGLTGAGLYLVMWGVMMIAMMYPSTVPLFRLYYRTLEGTTKVGKATRVGAFMGTYALVWTVTGIVPLVVNAVVPIAAIANESSGVLMGGTLLLLAGYQLSPYKYRCLKYCRSPFGFLMSHHRPGVRGAIRMSWDFSVFCVGCCWALFAFMVVVGSMNILWMALLTVVLSLERVVAWGERLAQAVGILAGTAGVAIMVITIL